MQNKTFMEKYTMNKQLSGCAGGKQLGLKLVVCDFSLLSLLPNSSNEKRQCVGWWVRLMKDVPS